MLLKGFGVSLSVGLAAFLGALIFGALAALGMLRGPIWLRYGLNTLSATLRGIPELVTMLLVFYGVPTLINQAAEAQGWDWQLDLPPFFAGAVTLALIYGAFCAEVIRGAAIAVPAGQYEACRALALPRRAILLRSIGPQILVRALPGLSNVWLVLLKATALMSVIQLEEIMRMAQIAARATRQPFYWFFLASLAYLAASLISIWIKTKLERRSARALGL